MSCSQCTCFQRLQILNFQEYFWQNSEQESFCLLKIFVKIQMSIFFEPNANKNLTLLTYLAEWKLLKAVCLKTIEKGQYFVKT